MRLRNASINDLHQLAELEALCFPPAEAADIYAIEERLETFPNHFWLLEENGKIISMIDGCCSEKPALSDEWFLPARMSLSVFTRNLDLSTREHRFLSMVASSGTI